MWLEWASMTNLKALCVFSSTEVKREWCLAALLCTQMVGISLSLTSFPSFPRQKAMCKCLSSPSLPMTSIDFLWGGAGAIHQQALASFGVFCIGCQSKESSRRHRLALGLSRNRCVYSEDFKFSEDSVRVVKQRMLLWLENGSFIRRKWICYQSMGRVNNNCTNTLWWDTAGGG